MMFYRLPALNDGEFYRIELNTPTGKIIDATKNNTVAKQMAREMLESTSFTPVKIYAVERATGNSRLLKTLDK